MPDGSKVTPIKNSGAVTKVMTETVDAAEETAREATGFDGVLQRVLARRQFIGGAVSMGAAAFVLGVGGFVPRARAAAPVFDFRPVPANSFDTVTVPEGYSWRIVAGWGDPLWSSGQAFDPITRGTAISQQLAFGDNNDGMALFTDGVRTVLAVNNEYINRSIMFGNRDDGKPATTDDVIKGMAGHGVSIVQISQQAGQWTLERDQPLNRRITAATPMRIAGPARGHAWLRTAGDPNAEQVLGTLNNCGAGRTPWGTYLTCEENFDGYFSSSDPDFVIDDAKKRYGIKARDRGYDFARADERFDISKHPNEANRFGYIVEIDPLDPKSMPVKRTALGRFKHENAEVVINASGHVVVYMGDDERGEFLYRYVSKGTYKGGKDSGDLLDDGTLYAAKFNDDMTGTWLALTPETTAMNDAEIRILSRFAASRAGATTMDRPEWIAAHPQKAELYCALTNNKDRGKKPNAGGDATPVSGPNPRAENLYGQVVRWRPDGSDHTADTFAWDLFCVAGNPAVHQDANRGSKNIDADNMFNAPDGLAFDSRGRLWIQTDGNYSDRKDFAGMGNNQMLVADPLTGDIRRFMVGPKECEITGLCWDTDYKTMFVGIQHPGERGGSHFPDGGDSVPRSCVIAVTKSDGTPIG